MYPEKISFLHFFSNPNDNAPVLKILLQPERIGSNRTNGKISKCSISTGTRLVCVKAFNNNNTNRAYY